MVLSPLTQASELTIEAVDKFYGHRQVVNQVSLSVTQGEVVGLLGPNGAGKTTTFYIATGLERPTRGRVWFNGVDITSLPLHRRAHLGIGYLAQEPSIFRRLTVRENILLVLQESRVPRRYWQERLKQLLQELRLEKVASTLGIQVSGGERRRTELARALAAGLQGPKFLLLDEPFAGVDPIAVAEIQEIIHQLRRRSIGILITDHNVRETLAITDRAYILRDGQVLAAGTPEQLYADTGVRKYYLGDRFQR